MRRWQSGCRPGIMVEITGPGRSTPISCAASNGRDAKVEMATQSQVGFASFPLPPKTAPSCEAFCAGPD